MTFKIKTLSVKNFMSVGNSTQAVQFDRKDLTLVLGQNLDLGGDDTGARNGTGKTTIINALSYALYGSALTNIKKDNLINKTNGKNMLVTIEFEKDGVDYRIERGRRPNTMGFYIGGEEQQITDESQGDSRETQAHIERMLGMSHDMFKHIVALNTYTEPFLALKANDQRTIIEQLLGITVLSEKADALKEQFKATKDAITQEEYRIKAVTDANARIQEQIEATRRRQTLWTTKRANEIVELEQALDVIGDLDIEQELANHNLLNEYNNKTNKIREITKWKVACDSEQIRLLKQLDKLKSEIEKEKRLGDKGGYRVTIRWHDAGDFFSPEYMDMAFKMAESIPDVNFYAYTKIASAALANKPNNFIINWSEGASKQQERQVKASDPKL